MTNKLSTLNTLSERMNKFEQGLKSGDKAEAITKVLAYDYGLTLSANFKNIKNCDSLAIVKKSVLSVMEQNKCKND